AAAGPAAAGRSPAGSSLRRADDAAVERLQRPRVHRIGLAEARDLAGRQLRRALQHVPGDAFAARRRRQRARARVVAAVARQQVGRIDLHALEFDLGLLVDGDVAPERSDHGIGVACLQQDGDDRELAGVVLVDEMDDHLAPLAVDALFARLVEVELLQLVAVATDGDRVAGCGNDLDRVPVVDDLRRAGLVRELDRRQRFALDRLGADVDRRLRVPGLAARELGLERGPVRRAAVAPVAPVRRGAGGERSRCRADERYESEQRTTDATFGHGVLLLSGEDESIAAARLHSRTWRTLPAPRTPNP